MITFLPCLLQVSDPQEGITELPWLISIDKATIITSLLGGANICLELNKNLWGNSTGSPFKRGLPLCHPTQSLPTPEPTVQANGMRARGSNDWKRKNDPHAERRRNWEETEGS